MPPRSRPIRRAAATARSNNGGGRAIERSMRLPMTLRVLRSGWLLMALLPYTAHAASLSQEEYQQATHSKADLSHGEALFASCAMCHGADAGGVPDGSVPAIGGQHFRVIVRQLVDYRHDKRWDLRMEHFTDEHRLKGAQDIADVAAFVSQL